MNNKIRVGVIFGGKSGEHEVSLASAKSVIQALNPDNYAVVPIGIDKEGGWHLGTSAEQYLQSGFETNRLGSNVDDAQSPGQLAPNPQGHTGVPSALVRDVDVFIPVLHGSYGEDGTIQGMLEMLDVPYVGAGVLASAVGMDKTFMKRLFATAGLPQVRYTFFTRTNYESNPEEVINRVEGEIGYPCFVKPANLGSSVGISKARDRQGLRSAIEEAARYDRKVIVEEGLNVREIEVAVLGNDHPRASVAGEVVPSNEFYDYRAKYIDGESALIIPAPLSESTMEEVRSLAIQAFQAVDCTGLARVDFFIEKETDRVIVNEINTMPGFTQFSMYPKLWEASGVSYTQLIDTLIQLALGRHDEKRRNITNFELSLEASDLV